MKLTKYMIPYPVLGIEGGFNETCQADSKLTFETTLTKFVFHVQLSMDDETIRGLIESNLAAFACEIDCPKTFYRKVFMCEKDSFSIEIPRTSLAEDVQFFFSVVAVTSINGYSNPNFNARYYQGYQFNIQKGNLLAYLGERPFNAKIQWDELKALGSIMEVKEDSSADYTHFDFAHDKIRIFLPTEEFQNFYRSNNGLLADITHASIVQCCLISALHSFKDFRHTLWAQTLIARIKSESYLKPFENIEELDANQVSQFVNILLDNPNKRMFAKINTLRNTSLV